MKTKRCIAMVLFVSVLISVYSYINLRYEIRINEAVNIWYAVIFQGKSLTPLMMYVLPLSAIMVSIVQFTPEMTDKRLKLTLHLPAKEINIMISMLLYGYATLLILYTTTFFLIFFLMLSLFSLDIVIGSIAQISVWMTAGFISYGLTSWIVLEPKWKYRILNICIAIAMISVLYINTLPFGYSDFKSGLMTTIVVSFFFPVYSCIRFKEGI